ICSQPAATCSIAARRQSNRSSVAHNIRDLEEEKEARPILEPAVNAKLGEPGLGRGGVCAIAFAATAVTRYAAMRMLTFTSFWTTPTAIAAVWYKDRSVSDPGSHG